MERLTERQLTAAEWNQALGASQGERIVQALAPFYEKPLVIAPAVDGLADRVRTAWNGIGSGFSEYSIISLGELERARQIVNQHLPEPFKGTSSYYCTLGGLLSTDAGVFFSPRSETLEKETGKECNKYIDNLSSFWDTIHRSLGFNNWEGGQFTQNLREYLSKSTWIENMYGLGGKACLTYPLERNFVELWRQYVVFMAAGQEDEVSQVSQFLNLYLAGNYIVGFYRKHIDYSDRRNSRFMGMALVA